MANAVLDGVDGILLGAETLRGMYPLETVRMVARICRAAEMNFDHYSHHEMLMGEAFWEVRRTCVWPLLAPAAAAGGRAFWEARGALWLAGYSLACGLPPAGAKDHGLLIPGRCAVPDAAGAAAAQAPHRLPFLPASPAALAAARPLVPAAPPAHP